MSKRNFILLVIVLIIIIFSIFGFLLSRKNAISPVDGDTDGTNFISNFNPFGNNTKPPTDTTTNPVDVSGYQTPPETTKLALRKISSVPVAGYAVFQKERLKDVPVVMPETPVTPPADIENTTPVDNTKKPIVKPTPPLTEFAPALRYVDRATGNIYQTFADKVQERRFSSMLIPKVYEAFFANSGQAVFMRYLKADGRTIQTFFANLPKEYLGADTTGDNELKGTFLPDNVSDLSVLSDTSSVFYLSPSGDNASGTTLNISNGKKVEILNSPFTEWLSTWPNNKMVTLTTKPASGYPGYMYSLDTSSKNITKVIGDVNGLSTFVSPNGKLVLYSNDSLTLNIYHTDTKVSEILGIHTMPEKCVWGKQSDYIYCAVPKNLVGVPYPDSWYKGEISFNDEIWRKDVVSGVESLISDPAQTQGGEEIDGIKLGINEGENYLFFVNKKDSFLWELSLK